MPHVLYPFWTCGTVLTDTNWAVLKNLLIFKAALFFYSLFPPSSRIRYKYSNARMVAS